MALGQHTQVSEYRYIDLCRWTVLRTGENRERSKDGEVTCSQVKILLILNLRSCRPDRSQSAQYTKHHGYE